MDEKNSAKSHDCSVCKEDAWKICDSCRSKTTTCPVCRTAINPISPHNVVIEIPQSERRNANVIRAGSICKEICKYLIFCLQRLALFFLVVYLGKCYIYAYCAGTCDTNNRYIKDKDTGKVTDKCTCYDYVNTDNYWERFDRLFGELLIGIFVNAVLIGCCVKNR
tara:strand:- start:1348 stop:1842 length:495 start_codon:yes stop_codon:yes gene_type:complete